MPLPRPSYPEGIRGPAPKSYFVAPYPHTYLGAVPPAAPHTYIPRRTLPGRPNLGTKYDVRAVYPPSHVLCQSSPKRPPPPEPSVEDYIVRADVRSDDAFLWPVWKEAAGPQGVWVSPARFIVAPSRPDAPCPPSAPRSSPSLLLTLVMLLFLALLRY